MRVLARPTTVRPHDLHTCSTYFYKILSIHNPNVMYIYTCVSIVVTLDHSRSFAVRPQHFNQHHHAVSSPRSIVRSSGCDFAAVAEQRPRICGGNDVSGWKQCQCSAQIMSAQTSDGQA